MKVKQGQRQRPQKLHPKKVSFSMYFSLLKGCVGVASFFFIASFIYRYSSGPQQNMSVLGAQTMAPKPNGFWGLIFSFFAQFIR